MPSSKFLKKTNGKRTNSPSNFLNIESFVHVTTSHVELHLDLVFQFGIGRYFPGILPTDTKGKLGQDVLVSYIWQEPLFSLKGRLLPPF
jgi:hypothetical protein